MVRLVRQCMSLDKDRIMFFSFFYFDCGRFAMVRLVRQCMSLDKDRIRFYSFFISIDDLFS
jgi:hypothetical protein